MHVCSWLRRRLLGGGQRLLRLVDVELAVPGEELQYWYRWCMLAAAWNGSRPMDPPHALSGSITVRARGGPHA